MNISFDFVFNFGAWWIFYLYERRTKKKNNIKLSLEKIPALIFFAVFVENQGLSGEIMLIKLFIVRFLLTPVIWWVLLGNI